MVDTGTPFTSITTAQVEEWGLTDQIQPCDDVFIDGILRADIFHRETGQLLAKDFSF